MNHLLFHNLQTGSGVYPVSCSVVTTDSFLRIKRLELEVGDIPI
jgi:hypothetical protein